VKDNFNKMDMKEKLSLLWIFAMFNYTYADILTLMDSSVLKEIISGTVGGMELTQGFLFVASFLMILPIFMIVLSRILPYKNNRRVNIIAGIIKTLAVFGSTFVGTPAAYYMLFGAIEIATTSYIVWISWKWKE